jgi:hypothetical protein
MEVCVKNDFSEIPQKQPNISKYIFIIFLISFFLVSNLISGVVGAQDGDSSEETDEEDGIWSTNYPFALALIFIGASSNWGRRIDRAGFNVFSNITVGRYRFRCASLLNSDEII